MPAADCIGRDELRAFSLGRVDDARFETIQTHLSECPTCEDTVASFDDTADSLIASVRVAARDDAPVSAAAGQAESDVLRDALSRVATQAVRSPDEADHASMPRVVERIRDYELVEQLGAGGMGTVYRAMHTRLEREVALKLLPARRLRDEAAVARFEREMKAIGRLDHPAIVRATDAGVVDGTHFLAMDYVEGIDVSRLVRLNGPLDLASACEIIRQAAIGLQYAHEQGLIHRDVKPSNLMLNRRGEVRILDLGLALFGAASEAVDELTTVGQLMGTLDYMAPEQCDNSHDVDARADVYSLGATLFKLLSGTAPYDSEGQRTPLAKMKALATIDAPSLADCSDGLPGELIEVVDRSLSRDCDDRFASASDIAVALEPFCAGHKLAELAESGLALAAEADVEPDLPAAIPAFVRHAASDEDADRRTGTPARPASPEQSSGRAGVPILRDDRAAPARTRSLLNWLLLPIVLLAGIVIWIQTDTGTLHIECVDDDVPIEIRRGEEVVQSETLSVGKNELTIRSGRFEIVLPKEYDALKVEDGDIELTRGGNDYARITRIPRMSPASAVSGFPVHPVDADGMTAVQVPVRLFGESLVALPGDQADVHVIQELENENAVAARTIAESIDIVGMDNPQKMGDVIECDMTFRVTPIIADRLRAAAPLGALQLTLRSEVAPNQSDHPQIPEGMRLVAVDAYEPIGASRQTQPGDLIDLLVTFIRKEGGDQVKVVKPVVEGVTVYSVDRPQRTGGELFPALRVGLLVSPEEADRVLLARDAGRLDFKPGSKDEQRAPAEELFDVSMLDRDQREQIVRARTAARATTPVETTLEPVFSGRTFVEWKRQVLSERNPEELESAINALCILGRGNRDREAAETVLQILTPYPLAALPGRHSRPQTMTPETKLVVTAIRQLRGLKPDEIIEPVSAALGQDSPLLQRLIIQWLAEAPSQPVSVQAPVGRPDPLRSSLLNSAICINAILDLWEIFDEETRRSAFRTISDVALGAGQNERLIARLEDIVEQPESEFRVQAARLLSRIRPRPELADVFLDALEKPYSGTPGQHLTVGVPSVEALWWGFESDAWLGLINLGDRTKSSVPRLIDLLSVLKKKNALDVWTMLTVPLENRNSFIYVPISRRMLIYELLGRLGPDAQAAQPAIVASMQDFFGVAPDPAGDFGFVAAEERFLIDHQRIHSASAMSTGPGVFSVVDRYGEEIARGEESPTLYGTVLNAAVLALQRMTGEPVRYVDMVFRKEPPAADPNGGEVLYGAGEPGGGRNNRDIPVAWFPKLVTYRGRTFGEWQSAAAKVHETNPSFDEMEDIIDGVAVLRGEELRGDDERHGDRRAAMAVSLILRHVLATQSFFVTADEISDQFPDGIPAELTAGTAVIREEAFNLALTAFGRISDFDGGLAETVAIDTLAHGTDQARWLFVYWIANPQTQIADSESPLATEYSWNLNSLKFAEAFRNLFDDREWQGHSSTLKHAMLRLAWRFAAEVGRETDHNDLLAPLLRSRLATEKDLALRARLAIVLARYHSTSALAVNTKSHRVVQDALVEGISSPDSDASLVDLVTALNVTARQGLDQSAEELVRLIRADSAEGADPGSFRIRIPPPVHTDNAMGIGTIPGVRAGGWVADGYSETGPGTEAQHRRDRVVSRRVLLVQLLTEGPLNDPEVRLQVAAHLLNLIETPVMNWTDDRSPLKDFRRAWSEGTRTASSRPATPKEDAIAFRNAVVACIVQLDPSAATATRLFGEQEEPSASDASRQAGVYDGQNYSQWLETVMVERSPARLLEAVQALRLLGSGEHDAEVAAAILFATRLFNVHGLHVDHADGKFLISADEQLRQLDPTAIFPSLVTAFRTGNSNQRLFVCTFLQSTGLGSRTQVEHGLQTALQVGRSAELRDAIPGVWKDQSTSPVLHAYLFPLIEQHFVKGDRTHDSIVALLRYITDKPPPEELISVGADDDLQLLREHWRREFRDRRLRAAFLLTTIDPAHTTLVKLLVDELARPIPDGQNWWHTKRPAVLGLTRLAARAKNELPRLVKMLNDVSDLRRNFGADNDEALFLPPDFRDASPRKRAEAVVLNTRIALVELIALIAIIDQQREPDASAIAVLKKIAEQHPARIPKPDDDSNSATSDDAARTAVRGFASEWDFSTVHFGKTEFALPRLLARLDSGKPIEAAERQIPTSRNGYQSVSSVEQIFFHKTALLALKVAGISDIDLENPYGLPTDEDEESESDKTAQPE